MKAKERKAEAGRREPRRLPKSSQITSADRSSLTLEVQRWAPEDVLDLQHRFGNAAVTDLFASQRAVQRAPAAASELMTPATQETAGGVREHPVTEGPVETEATGIEGTAVEASLNKFLEIVNQELGAWETYRHAFQAPIPGEAAYHEAEMLKDYLRALHREPMPTVQTPLGKMRVLAAPTHLYDPRVKQYLARHLGPQKLYLLREMVSFGRTPTGLSGASQVLAELFDIKPIPLWHEYECVVTGNRGGMVGEGLGLGGYVKHFEIRYHNSLGMHYVKQLSGVDVAFFGGAGAEWSPGGKKGGHHGPEREFEVEFEAKGETSDPVFWEPDDFVGDFFTVEKVSASAGGSIGPIGGGVEAKLFELVKFYNSDRGKLTFNLVERWIEPAAVKVKQKFKLKPEVGAKAGIEGHSGVTWGSEKARVTSPDVPRPERKETGEWRVLLEAQAFFATGRADVTEEATHTIAKLVDRVHAFKARHPDYQLKFVVTGHASPRWAHPVHGKTRDDLNTALSERRAQHTLEQIRNVFRNVGRGPAAYELQSSPGPEMSVDDSTANAMVRGQGSLEARAEHRDPNDDWWHDRRVDIIVYRNEFGIVTEKPPEIPGHAEASAE